MKKLGDWLRESEKMFSKEEEKYSKVFSFPSLMSVDAFAEMFEIRKKKVKDRCYPNDKDLSFDWRYLMWRGVANPNRNCDVRTKYYVMFPFGKVSATELGSSLF